jgi:hypothetical protein
MTTPFRFIHGVDFSGARLAGRAIWIATAEPGRRRLRLKGLSRLDRACGTAERGPVLAFLVERILASVDSLWSMDFPFGFPLEVLADGTRWRDQLAFLGGWGEDAYAAGVECCRRAEALGYPKHVRRLTDAETKATFDSYHYRII